MWLFSGRSAEIFDFEPGWVAKVPKPGFESILSHEASNYRALGHVGVPMPRSRGVMGGRLVIEKIEGETMLAVLRQDPSRQVALAGVYVDLWERLHAVSPHELIPVRRRIEWGVGRSVGTLPGGENVLCHFDFHPDNVILSVRGPVIVDWVDALSGPVAADYARTLLLLGYPGRSWKDLPTFVDRIYRFAMDRDGAEVRA